MRYLTAGESHGPALVGIIEGLPAGLKVEEEDLNRQLVRRQGGYGRGGRMSIEKDQVRFFSGVRFGRTTGGPLSLTIENKDWANWERVMAQHSAAATDDRRVTCPRPGHADLAGGIKYLHHDLRDVLERASARETAMRVAIGSVAALLLNHFGIKSVGFVLAAGGVAATTPPPGRGVEAIREKTSSSPLYCLDEEAERLMMAAIDRAREEGDTLGGVFEILVEGLPPGLGSHVQGDRRLDGRLAGALMSIPGVKGVEIGLGFAAAEKRGSQVHDTIAWQRLEQGKGTTRFSNHAGGLEGGMTNGEPLVIRAAMKPIPTLRRALPSIDLATGGTKKAAVERSDTCAVAAAAVIGEAQVNWELARAFLEKFKGDSLLEIEAGWRHYQQLIKDYLNAGGS